MEKYRILTFDGGGVRGILSIMLLQKLTKRFPKLIEQTDMFAGTSAGSFIALGLASGKAPKEIFNILYENADKIFGHPRWVHLAEPKYDNTSLIKVVEKAFGSELKLKDLTKKVVVPSFRLDSLHSGHWKPVFFNNFPNSTTANSRLKDVALSSSAAPTYFPSYKKHIDGGVFSNNPSTAAIAFALDETIGDKDLSQTTLLSIGTGSFPYRIEQDTTNWGELQWMGVPFFYSPGPSEPTIPLMDILTDGVSEADSALSAKLLQKRFHRFNPELKQPIALDDVKGIPKLVDIAKKADYTDVEKFIYTEYLS